MIKVRLMNSKEKKELKSMMMEEFGSAINGVLYLGSKGKVFLGTKWSMLIDLKSVNAEGVGVYIGRINPDGFRPTIEGVQLLRPAKNVFELSKEQVWDWLRGYPVTLDTKYEGYCALSYNGELLGPGKISRGKLWNYVPKERRIKRLIK